MQAPNALAPIDVAMLTPIVRRALGSETAEPRDWTVTSAGYKLINEVTAGLYRVAGTAHDGDTLVPWSIFLKVLRASSGDSSHGTPSGGFTPSDEPQHWNYWKREALLYASGLLDDLAPDLVAPRCFAVTADSPAEASIWLEEIHGVPAADWPVERFGLAACHLGRFQGAYLAGRPLPSYDWLSRHGLRQWAPDATYAAPELLRDPAAWQHPLIRPHLPAEAQRQAIRLWAARDALLDAVERLPRTLCHLDFWPPNLFAGLGAADGHHTVLIDWSFAGLGAPTEDTANLVMDCVWMFKQDPAHLERLEQVIVEGYSAGVHEAGWHGDERLLHFAHAAVTGLRYGLLAGGVLALAHDTSRHDTMQQWHSLSIEEIIARRCAVIRRSLALGEEAIRVMRDA